MLRLFPQKIEVDNVKIQWVASGLIETNAGLIMSPETKEAVVIDPAEGSFLILSELAKAHELKIQAIWLTHSHWDHIADAFYFVEEFGSEVLVHPFDSENLLRPGSDGLPIPIPIHPIKKLSYFKDFISIGGYSFKIIHTPGHSPGSVCFYLEELDWLISGDTLFKGSHGAVRFPHSNPSHMRESLRTLSLLPPSTQVFPGHGEGTSIGDELNFLRYICR